MSDFHFEGAEATFSIHTIGAVDKQTYMGAFKVKCVLDPLSFINADAKYRELLGKDHPEMAHEHTRSLAFALSQLHYRVVEAPPFWENKEIGGAHCEDNIIIEVLNIAMEAESEYRKKLAKVAEERQERLTNLIKKGEVEKEPEVKEADTNEGADEEMIEMDEEDGTTLGPED